MPIVLDTASFIAAMRSPTGAARRLLELILGGEVIMLMDYKLSLEYRSVALRAEHLEAAEISKSEMLRVIEVLEELAQPVSITPRHRPLSSDPNDDMVLDLAINGDAKVIVTLNRRHFADAARRLRIMVLSPAQMLDKLRKEKNYVNGAR